MTIVRKTGKCRRRSSAFKRNNNNNNNDNMVFSDTNKARLDGKLVVITGEEEAIRCKTGLL